MSKTRILLTAFALAFIQISLAEEYITDIPLEKVEQAFNKPLPPHPRLFINKNQVSALREKIRTNDKLKAFYDSMLQEADKILERQPVQRVMTGKRLLHVSRECLKRVFMLSTAYLIDGDDKYLKRAEKEMLAAAAFDDWNPAHYLDVAEMTAALAIGYDWLYDGLSEESRQTIRQAIVTKGIEPSFVESSQNWWIKCNMNWNQVCNGGLALGALAIAENDPNLARTIVHRSVNGVQFAMAEYEPDGAYPEGPGYWIYGTSYNVLLFAALDSALGTDFGLSERNGFVKSADYYLHMTGPTGQYFNYPDCGSKGLFIPTIYWFVQKYNKPALSWNQNQFWQKALKDEPLKLLEHRCASLILLWSNVDIEVPKELCWMGRGANPVAVFRSSWTDPDAVYLGIKGGSPGTEHGHMDAGSFVIDAEGVRWAIDFGPENYNKIETLGMDLWNRSQNSDRWKIFRYNNFSHNTLVVNNQQQRVRGMATITHYSDKKEFPHAVIDMTSVYKGQLAKAVRGGALMPAGQIIIQDELQDVNQPATIRWAMATPAEVNIQSGKLALLSLDGKEMLFEILSPDNAKLAVYSTEPRADYDQPNPGTRMVGFEVKLSPDEEMRLAVRLTPAPQKVKLKDHKLVPLASWSQPLEP
ncbi:MAG: heparinase II/III family protein [Sedimentisphaerales bacterium]|nr:heparinase II/III family protein [Sedimentisphaerales bacterium]